VFFLGLYVKENRLSLQQRGAVLKKHKKKNILYFRTFFPFFIFMEKRKMRESP